MTVIKLVSNLKRYRGRLRRIRRLLFTSPIETRFIRIMGGHVLTMPIYMNGFPLTIVISKGSLLRQEHFRREVRYGKYFVDFANDVHRIIEIDGASWHMNVVADAERDNYIRAYETDAQILRIKASLLKSNPAGVRHMVKLLVG